MVQVIGPADAVLGVTIGLTIVVIKAGLRRALLQVAITELLLEDTS